ncbi:MAG: hypothetical protein A2750_04395 [Candidatus Yanofskybacteria bacterium RIFCSPHIGHO2_01_FULL_45_42]|uniref:Uncharacterized protein n=1 Tax=Candidatus Yanofskybacteria bacterium RIFCSPHIGHO2_01_FULL_45_42 TaxID=1802671 RepID=A0A1F8F4T8_9BACT|nr:MAG: hypothetical protein A2750_04395 [Candidatus Yanofskybacteria bacterium RIFCSPHIGHO2_01_FULL_45_42]
MILHFGLLYISCALVARPHSQPSLQANSSQTRLRGFPCGERVLKNREGDRLWQEARGGSEADEGVDRASCQILFKMILSTSNSRAENF